MNCPYCNSSNTGINRKPSNYICHDCGKYFTPKKEPVIQSTKVSSLEPQNRLSFTLPLIKDAECGVIIPIGDIHVGAPEGQCDISKLDRELNYIMSKEGGYMIGMGDYLDMATKVVRKGPNVFKSSLSPMEQYEVILDKFKPLAEEGKIIGLLSGNHEAWAMEDSGTDWVALLCQNLKVPYLGRACDIEIFVTQEDKVQKYLMYAQHGSSNAVSANTKIGSAMNAVRDIFADIYLYGHVHQVAATKTAKWMLGEERKSYHIVTGHFLNWRGSYAQAFGVSPSPTGVAKIELFGNRRDIHISI